MTMAGVRTRGIDRERFPSGSSPLSPLPLPLLARLASLSWAVCRRLAELCARADCVLVRSVCDLSLSLSVPSTAVDKPASSFSGLFHGTARTGVRERVSESVGIPFVDFLHFVQLCSCVLRASVLMIRNFSVTGGVEQ